MMAVGMTRPARTWWWILIAIVALAALLRVWNLGTFSLWFDEIFTVTVADQPLIDTLGSCARDAKNVPLYAVLANIGLALGAGETALRIAPIAAGVASIVLLAVWTRRHFGDEVALLAAAFCALAPFHVRYSQELRAYPYLLLVGALTLLAADRLRERPDWRSTAGLAVTVALGCSTHLTYPMILVPAAGSLLLPAPDRVQSEGRSKRVWGLFSLAVGTGVATLAPWLWLVSRTPSEPRPPSSTADWSFSAVGDRWHVLTLGAWEHDGLTWLSLLLAGLALMGLVLVLREPIGRLVFLPAIPILVAWELLLVAMGHWSSARYAIVMWPLLAVLVALGFHRVLVALPWRGARIAACATATLLMLVYVDDYYERGRPHWDRVASVVQDARRSGEPVIANSHWTRRCLSHYLGEQVPTVAGRPERLAGLMNGPSSVLLVSRTASPPEELLAVGARSTELAAVPNTAWVHRLESSTGRTAGRDAGSNP
jgi:4-amino-4-deoxy-L-arabinose transferase-like glycosyltransferase